MKTKKRFFLKAAGISLAKAAGISLAFVLTFAMAFAACDTGTSSGGKKTETEDDTDTGNVPSNPTPDPVYTTYRDSTGNYVLTITESGAVSYTLAVSGVQRSYGTVTKGTSAWTFSSYYTGESFTLYVSGSEPNLIFTGSPTITADNGGTVTIPTLSLTGSSGENNNPQPEQPGTTVKDETQLRDALKKDATGNHKKGVFRITSSEFELKDDLVVYEDQHIIVGGTYQSETDKGQYSAGGPLFAITGTSNTFNIGARLRLEDGASLSITRGAAVNVKSGGTLYAASDANGGAKVGVGVNVSGSNPVAFGGSGVSSLYIEGGGALHIAKTATLAVTNNPSASKVRLETATSALTLEDTAILLIEVVTAPAVNPETEATDATLEAARIIGSTTDDVDNVIEIPGTAPAAIGTVDVTYESDDATYAAAIAAIENDIGTKVTDAAGTATDDSPAKTTDEVSGDTGVQALLDEQGVTSVIYSGDTALTGISIPQGKTLVISGAVTNQSAAITGAGTLEITGSVETADASISETVLASLVKASGGGKVVLKGKTSDGPNSVSVGGALVVNLTLEIESGAALAISASGGIGGTGPIVNKGTISTAQASITSTDLGDILKRVGGNDGTFEVTAATIAVASGTLAIPADTTLKLSGTAKLEVTGTLTVAGTLTNDGAIAFNAGSTLVVQDEGSIGNDSKTIETKSGTVLAVLLNNVTDGTIEVTEVGVTLATPATLNASATLKVAENKTLIINGVTLTVEEDATITATGTGSGTITNNGIIEAENVTALATVLALTGINGKVAVSGTDVTLVAATIPNGVTLSVPTGQILTVPAGVTLNVAATGTLTTTADGNTGKVEVAEAANALITVATGGTVTGDVTKTVTGSYELPIGTEDLPPVGGGTPDVATPKNYDATTTGTPDITLAAKKSLATTGAGAGFITIKLTGNVTDTTAGANSDKVVDLWFGGNSDSPTTGKFAIATIKGLFASVKEQNKLLKNYNPSWAYYKGTTFPNIKSSYTEMTTPTSTSGNYIWLGDSTNTEAFNWSYRAGSSATPDDDELTLLLWSGAGTKQAKLEVTAPPDAGTTPTYTVIVDWSDVTINAAD